MFSIQFLHNKQITFPIEYLCLLLNSHKELLIKKFLLSVNDGENLILTIVFSLSIIISLFQTSGRILERSNMSDYVESEKEAKEYNRLLQHVLLQSQVKTRLYTLEKEYIIFYQFFIQ